VRRLPRLLFYVLVFLSILIPFLYWQGVWFGKELTLGQIEHSLQDPATAERHLQHALSKLLDHIERGDPAAERLYPDLIRLTTHPSPEIRKTVAWLLGADPSAHFREAARGLLGDENVLVRQQAALALAKHGDPAALPELRAMLEPHPVGAPVAGRLQDALRAGEPVRAGTRLARIEAHDGRRIDVPAPLGGRVEALQATIGAELGAGAAISTISPSTEAVLHALVALQLIGTKVDAPLVTRYAERADLGDDVRRQARRTLEAVSAR
jgi:HEAT repeat protein